MAAVLSPPSQGPQPPPAPNDPFWSLLQLDYDSVEKEIQDQLTKRVVNSSFSSVGPGPIRNGIHKDKLNSSVDVDAAELSISEQLSRTKARYRTSSPLIMDAAAPAEEHSKEQQKLEPITSTPIAEPTGPAPTSDLTPPTLTSDPACPAPFVPVEEDISKEQDIPDEDKTSARLVFRWAKALPTQANHVYLKSPFQGSPIRLQYNKGKGVYESEEYQVPVGDHNCQLNVDMKDHKVEPLQIRFYTFECDVFLTEEEEASSVELGERRNLARVQRSLSSQESRRSAQRKLPFDDSKPLRRAASLQSPTRQLEKGRSSERRTAESGVQRTETRVTFSDERRSEVVQQQQQLSSASLTQLDISGVDVMDDDMDVQSVDSAGGIKRSRLLERLVQRQLGLGAEDPGKEADVSSVQSDAARESFEKADYIGEYKEIQRETRHESWEKQNGRSLSPTRLSRTASSEQELNRYLDPSKKNTDAGIRTQSPERHDTSRQYYGSKSSETYRKYDRSLSPTRATDSYSHAARTGSADILDSRREERTYTSTTQAVNGYMKGDQRGNYHHSSLPSLANRPDGREPERRDYRTTRDEVDREYKVERDYKRKDETSDRDYKAERDYQRKDGAERDYKTDREFHRIDGESRDYANREQNYRSRDVENNNNDNDDRLGGRDRNSDRESSSRRERDRNYSSEKEYDADYVRTSRDYASDGEYNSRHERGITSTTTRETRTDSREPMIRPSLTTNRTVPLLRSSSTGKSAAPLSSIQSSIQDGNLKDRVGELESTVLSLKRVLTQRDSEIDDLRAANRNLENELRQARTSPAPSGSQEADKRINELIREKENLATEMWKLRQSLEDAQKQQPSDMDPDTQETAHLDNYDPNNKRALTRKIEDLHSQLRDLQEVNETTVSRLQRSEKEIDDIQEENACLKRNKTREMREMEEQNRTLRSQLDRITTLGNDSDYLKREIEQLREDLRSLRDKNHTLVQDNIKLTEHLRDIEVGPAHTATGNKYDQDKFDRDNFRVRGEKFNNDPSKPAVNGYANSHAPPPPSRRIRDGSPEGSTVSDSTAVLTSAAPSGMATEARQNDRTEDTREREREVHGRRSPITDSVGGGHYYQSSSNRHGRSSTDKLSATSSSAAYNVRSSVTTSNSTTTTYKANGHATYHHPPPAASSSAAASTTSTLNGYDHKMTYHRDADVAVAPPTNTSLVADEFLSEDEVDEAMIDERKGRGRRRKDSLNSNCTDFILGEAEQLLNNSVTEATGDRQSHVASGNRRELMMTPPGSPRCGSPSAGMLGSSLRTCSPKPQVTQHNKHIHGPPPRDEAFTLGGRRPFNPRSPADIQLGDLIKFSRQGGKISRGVVKYVGHLPGKNDTYCGVELEHEMGKHDGIYDEQRYFQSKPNKGVFVAFSKIVMAWGK